MDLAGTMRGLGGIGEDIGTGILDAQERKRKQLREDVELQQAKANRPLGQPIMGSDGKYYQIFLDPGSGKLSTQEVPILPGVNVEVMSQAIKEHISKAPKEMQEALQTVADSYTMAGQYPEALQAIGKIMSQTSLEGMKETARDELARTRQEGKLEGQQILEAQRNNDRKEQIRLKSELDEGRMRRLIQARAASGGGRNHPNMIRAQMLKTEIVGLQSKINQLDAAYAKQTFDPAQGKMAGPTVEQAESIERQKGIFYDEIEQKQEDLEKLLSASEQPLGTPAASQGGGASAKSTGTPSPSGMRLPLAMFFDAYGLSDEQRKAVGKLSDGDPVRKGGKLWVKHGGEMVLQAGQ